MLHIIEKGVVLNRRVSPARCPAPTKFINRLKGAICKNIVLHNRRSAVQNIDCDIVRYKRVVADEGSCFGKLNGQMIALKEIFFDEKIGSRPNINAIIPVINKTVIPDLHVIGLDADSACGISGIRTAAGDG